MPPWRRLSLGRSRHENKIVLLAQGDHVDRTQALSPPHRDTVQPGAVLTVQVFEDEGVEGGVVRDTGVGLRDDGCVQSQRVLGTSPDGRLLIDLVIDPGQFPRPTEEFCPHRLSN
jgi:hypothetical protein